MAVIRDVMPAFELVQPSSAVEAQKILEQHGGDAWILAGGLDSFDWLKDRIKRPKIVVDLSGIDELKGVRTIADGIEIGAMTTLTDIVNHEVVKQKFGLLAQSAELVASPQIRNQGTIGGNVRRTRAAGITEQDGPATAQAGTSAMPTIRLVATGNTLFSRPNVV